MYLDFNLWGDENESSESSFEYDELAEPTRGTKRNYDEYDENNFFPLFSDIKKIKVEDFEYEEQTGNVNSPRITRSYRWRDGRDK
jgi:hypothetical protein